MKYRFGKKSIKALEGVHPDLVKVVTAVMRKQLMDFSVNEGIRTIEKQKEYVDRGSSRTMNSRHLRQFDGFGHAVDLYPYPINMGKVRNNDPVEIARFGLLAGIMMSTARELGIELTWGADWDGDGRTLDHSFFDAPHFQTKKRR